VRGSRFLATSAPAIAGMLFAAGPASAASIWTSVASGTAGTIAVIATPKAGEVVFTTTAGKVFHLVAGSFVEATVSPAMPFAFEDLAMSPDGTVGIAVGEAGAIYRSADSGASWTKVTGTTAWAGSCGGGGNVPLAENLFSVHFASASVAYISGADDDILKSTDGGMHWSEVNKDSSSCLIHSPIGDTAWGEPNIGYLLSDDFGGLWRTTDGIGGSVGGTTQIGSSVNGFEGGDRLALDADDPLRMWATNPGPGLSYFQYSVNGGANWSSPTLTDDATTVSFLDLASGIGTNVIAVGTGGAIYTSLDGVSFTREPAPDSLAGATWEAVAFQPGSTIAWVGGTNGALLTTAQANVQPAPTTASPPASTAPPTTLIATAKLKPKCKVPILKGKSLKAAAKRLKAAHCALGQVTKKEGATAKDGEVTKVSGKPGKTLPAGTKIKVTLAP
jgi:photosystem II stability/assembly factor-like uncharacterized protein